MDTTCFFVPKGAPVLHRRVWILSQHTRSGHKLSKEGGQFSSTCFLSLRVGSPPEGDCIRSAERQLEVPKREHLSLFLVLYCVTVIFPLLSLDSLLHEDALLLCVMYCCVINIIHYTND